jgi:hypothetical protein
MGPGPHRQRRRGATGAHVRRSTGIIRKPVSSRQIRWAPSRWSFFYRGPLDLDPLAHATVVALFRARLGPLRTEATGAEQTPHVIRMVDDVEVMTNQIDDSSARPQAGAIAGRFRPRDDHARQSPTLRGGELRRSPGRRARAQAGMALSSVRPLPSPDGAPIDAKALGHHMNGNVTPEQFHRAESSPLELSWAPLWAHIAPPTVEHSVLGHYLCRIINLCGIHDEKAVALRPLVFTLNITRRLP